MADVGTFVLGAATLGVGAILAIGTEAIRRTWTRQDAADALRLTAELDRQRRIEERSEAAAVALLGVLDVIRERFRGCYGFGSEPETVGDLTEQLRRHSVELDSELARQHFEWIAESVESPHVIGQLDGHVPTQVAFQGWRGGREVLGALLRHEPIEEQPNLRTYGGSIQQYYEEMYPDPDATADDDEER